MKLVYQTFYIFFVVIEILLIAYLITSFFPKNTMIREKITGLVNPILEPIRYLLKRSIFNSYVMDFAPIISFIVISFLQQFFYVLL